MITKFFEGLGGELGKRWAAALIGPASLLVALGFGAWAMGREAGFYDVKTYLADRNDVEMVALAVSALAAVILLRQAVLLVEPFVARLLQGAWPFDGGPVGVRRAERWHRRRDEARAALIESLGSPSATRHEAREYARAMQRLREIPLDDTELRPTAAGNILRAAELRPVAQYGLDTAVCWPRLWVCLPEHLRKELRDAHAAMTAASTAFTWLLFSSLLVVWAVRVWSGCFAVAAAALLVGLLWAYRRYLGAIRVFVSLIDTAFDLYRKELYDALRWPRPATSTAELEVGPRVTQYLWGGLVVPDQRWTQLEGVEATPELTAGVEPPAGETG